MSRDRALGRGRAGEEPGRACLGNGGSPCWEEGGAPHLQVPVDDKAVVHVLQAQDDLGRVEAHVGLREDPVLGQVVVQVPA